MQFVAQKHERHDAPTPTLGSMFETNYAESTMGRIEMYESTKEWAASVHRKISAKSKWSRRKIAAGLAVSAATECCSGEGDMCTFPHIPSFFAGVIVMVGVFMMQIYVRRQLRYFLSSPTKKKGPVLTEEQEAAISKSVSQLSTNSGFSGLPSNGSRSRLSRGGPGRESRSNLRNNSRENLNSMLRGSQGSRGSLKRSTSRDSFCRSKSSDLGGGWFTGGSSCSPHVPAGAASPASQCSRDNLCARQMHCSRDNLALHLEEFASDNLPEELTDSVRKQLKTRGPSMGFNGVWVQDKRRSTSLDLHLEALNVPYLARAVARTASYKANIEQTGLIWIETTATSLLKNTTEYRLDGGVQIHPHPMDGSPVRVMTAIEGDRVVTRSTYLHHGLSQVVSRWLEDDGELYVVRNELVNKDGMLLDAVLYFDRVSKGK
mmetsp:Transcript_86520/g.244505  ORF Transcript_86520/g.244505 Transcript_86520/m.244505 type:complete len:432 (-) Transcript_86520:189-1484(-)